MGTVYTNIVNRLRSINSPHMHYYAGLAYGTEYIGPMKGI